MQVALLVVGYAIGLSVWVALAFWFLRRAFVAGRWSQRAVRARVARVPVPATGSATPAQATAGAEILAFPPAISAPAQVAALYDQRAA